jgi:uncharacterized membrane protein
MHLEVYKLIKSNNCKVSKEYLKTKLETHPYYPSILAAKDTLEELGLKTKVFRMAEKDFAIIEHPFIAHILNKKTEELLFINNYSDIVVKKNTFKDTHFTGVILTAENSAIPFGNEENDNNLNKEKQKYLLRSIVLISSLILFLFPLFVNGFNLIHSILLLVNIIGFTLSYFIIEKEFGISNTVSDMICKLSKKVGCETVLLSKAAKIFKWLSWGDIGLVYFITVIIYLTLVGISGSISQVPIFFVSVIAIIFPLYSMYYQIKVVKQLCMLCIGVLIIIGANFLISLYALNNIDYNSLPNNLISILVFFLLSLLMLTVWLLLKDSFYKGNQDHIYYTLYRRLKRNPRILLSVLDWQPLVEDCLISTNESVSFGNPDATFNIMIACNPYCNPCALAHNSVNDLFSKYSSKIRVAIRFALSEKNLKENDSKVEAVRYILQYIQENPNRVHDILHYWYKEMSFEKLVQKFPVNSFFDVEPILMGFVKWNTHLSIKGTPTFWLNGKEIPALFNWVDLFEQLPVIIEDSLDNEN